MTPDPRPPARVRLKPSEYTVLLAQRMQACLGRCECGCGRPAHSAHHMIGGPGRSDVAENIVMLNGDGTRGCHGALTVSNIAFDGVDRYCDPNAVRRGIRATIETSRQDVRRHVVAVKGWDWLERHYPQRA